jgi:ankyrin repeat protein
MRILGILFLIVMLAAVMQSAKIHASPADDILKAAQTGSTARVKALLDKDPKLANARNPKGSTPLHFAAKGGYRDLVTLLIAKGADVNAKNREGLTPLHVAAMVGNLKIVEMLLSKGADMNARDLGKKTPLQYAIINGRQDVVAYLKKRGAL